MRAKDLYEALFMEKYTAGNAIKKYPDNWIHFTDINKLGINPDNDHDDPPGIYFYPCKYFIDDKHHEDQYAINFKYYYICDINLNSNGINLKTLTLEQARNIAIKNNWLKEFDFYINNSSNMAIIKKELTMDTSIVGSVFYQLIKYLGYPQKFNTRKVPRTYLDLIKGIDYIYDPGLGIIEKTEPHQLIVINRKILNIIDFDLNKNNDFKLKIEIMKELASIYNSTLNIKNKKLHFSIKQPESSIEVTISNSKFSYGNIYFVNIFNTLTNNKYHKNLNQLSYNDEKEKIKTIIDDMLESNKKILNS